MKNKNIHIVPKGDGWAVKRVGANRASFLVDTKAEADKLGRDLARRDHVELVIHKKTGKFQDKDSFGNDPNPPKDNVH